MAKKRAILVLADGSTYEGESIGAEGFGVGELVFNTAMTGYQEILTDPSYARQIVTLTVAHVGNTGCNRDDMESSRAWVSGLVVRSCSSYPSNFRAEQSLPDWLKEHGVVAISGIDTRHLTIQLRDKGAIGACITTDIKEVAKAQEQAKAFGDLNGVDLAKIVTRQTTERWNEGRGLAWGQEFKPQRFHVVAYDYGVKHQILRILYDLGCHITLVPENTPVDDVLAMNPDGVLLTNGPGDPKVCHDAIASIQTLLKNGIPLFGICLGFQLLALACGAQSSKMKFGHHGANHPVAELGGDKRVFITSQNHGFMIDEASLPKTLAVTHRSLFDGSLQGIKHRQKPAFGFQGHPEASPGPHDLEVIFKDFIQSMVEKASTSSALGV